MKTISTFILLLSIILAKAQTGTIDITVYGIQSTQGNIVAYLFNADTYADEEDALHTIVSPVKEGTNLQFENIPAGTYAIILCHDENSNKEMDSNWLGVPKEYVGLSNNVFGSMGWPKFNEASFKVNENKTVSLSITVKSVSHF